MNKIIYVILGLVLLIGLGFGGYYLYNSWTEETVIGDDNGDVNDTNDGKPQIVRSDFYENFRDGELDSFWLWNDGGLSDNFYDVDYVKEELTLNAGARTSQWTSTDTAPVLSFLTDQDYQLTVSMIFSPKVDFQHAGIGLFDTSNNKWIRISRAYDSHALETDLDIADSVYVMERDDIDGVKKYKHVNFIDSKIYLRMTKDGEKVSFDYSRDGTSWSFLDQVERTGLSRETQPYIFVYSTEMVPVKTVIREIQFNLK